MLMQERRKDEIRRVAVEFSLPPDGRLRRPRGEA